MPPDPQPPALARRLLAAALPESSRWAVIDELDREYREVVRPARGAAAARGWYWRQALTSLPAAWRMRRRAGSRDRVPLAVRLEAVVRDVCLALRVIAARPALACGAILTCAIGIGVNVATFSVVDAIVFRDLPYPDASRIVRVWSANPRGIPRNAVSPPDFFDLEAGAGSIATLAAYTQADPVTLREREPLRLTSSSVTAAFFDVLGVRPAAGRGLEDADSTPATAEVVVVSDGLARRQFGAPAGAVGQSIVLDDLPRTIVGVLPAGFAFPTPGTDVWLPMPAARRQLTRGAHYLGVIGRLQASTTIDRLRDVLGARAGLIEAEYPSTNKGWGVTVAPLRDAIIGDVRQPLLVTLAAVACVLLIACANVANLLLTHSQRRRLEFTVRAALGASPVQIFRQHLIESGVIAAAGGLVGLAGAIWIVDVASAALPATLPRLGEVAINARVLAAAAFATCAIALLAGWWPASRAATADPVGTLRTQSGGSARMPGHRARGALIAVDIALTLGVLIVAGLLAKSALAIDRVDPGFDAHQVLLAEVSLSQRRHTAPQWNRFYEDVLDRLGALPDVQAVGAGAPLPLSGQPGLLRFGLAIEGRAALTAEIDRVYLRWATPGYFAAMGIPVRSGREFSRTDRADAQPVAIVDETLAARHFAGENPIGRRIRPSNDDTWREIIGVVGGVRQTRLEGDAEPHLYVAAAQVPTPVITFVLRRRSDPAALAPALRAAVHAVDPDEPVFNVRRLADLVDEATAQQRCSAWAIGAFAACAALLTIFGIYSLTSCWVSDATREIGLRMALGAGRRQVLEAIVGRGLRVIAVGLIAGVTIALAAGRVIASLLFGVDATDPVVVIGAVALVFVVALAATYLPARRAVRIDPAVSLKSTQS